MAQYPEGTPIADDLLFALYLARGQNQDGNGGLDVEADRASDPGVSDAVRHRRRNKPTLNCRVCVKRKVKCDRGRPACQQW